MKRQSLEYLNENWHTSLVGSAEASTILKIKPNTLRTRISRNQAMALKDEDGRQRASVSFTGFHLIYNLIQDRLIRFNVPLDSKGDWDFPSVYADWVQSKVLNDPFNTDAIIRFDLSDDGASSHLFEDGGIENWTGDAALILPIGTMVLRIAIGLYVKSGKPEVIEALSNAREFLSDTSFPISQKDV